MAQHIAQSAVQISHESRWQDKSREVRLA